jgi:hypothetical protein
MRPSLPHRLAGRFTGRCAGLAAALLALAACGGNDGERGPGDASPPPGPAHGAPDRVVSVPAGASFVGPLPAPGASAPATPIGGLGPPWKASFIGASAGSAPAPGAAVQTQDRAFTLDAAGSGLTIAGTDDDFLFVHRTLAGDGALVALLRAIEGCSSGRISFGTMIRAGSDAADAYALAAVSGAPRGTALQARSLQGWVATTLRLDATVSLPLWLKVERVGERARFGYSADGQTWTESESVVNDFGVEVEVGLAASSHRETPCRGLFESVEVIGAARPGD